MTNGVFEGSGAIRRFLNPDHHPPLPLVEIPKSLNPYSGQKIRIFGKMMGFLPLANVKSLPALSMIERAESEGKLKDVHSLVEASSGNTVFSEAVVARAFGIPHTIAYASNEVEPGKLRLLRLFGTEIQVVVEDICPDPSDPESAINQARRFGEQPGYFNPDQFGNEANPEAHRRWTAPQLLLQRPDMTVLCAGLGTTGTIYGVVSYLKEHLPNMVSVGVTRSANNPVPGVRTKNLLREISFPWERYADHIEEVGTRESYRLSALLCQEGMAVGPSSGFALGGLLSFLKRQVTENTLDHLRNEHGEIVAVFICPDTPFPYLEEYFKHLGDDFFPPMRGVELLQHSPEAVLAPEDSVVPALEPVDVFAEAYDADVGSVWSAVQSGMPEDRHLRDTTVLLDLRSKQEFIDHHLPGSLRIEKDHLAGQWDIFAKTMLGQKKRYVFICRYGLQSAYFAGKAKKEGIDAWNLSGGTMEWSRLNLPRIISPECLPSTK